MPKPLDIDGNELRVGDLVEIIRKTIREDVGLPLELGKIYLVNEIAPDNLVDDYRKKYGVNGAPGRYVGIKDRWIISDKLRLIPRDQKAPTRIEFVVKELTK